MKLRKLIRKAANAIGLDVHKHEKDCSAMFNPDFARIREVKGEAFEARFFVADNRDTIQSFHDRGQFYEEDICEEIAKSFNDSGYFVDIGANVGNHSIYIAKRFPTSRIVAVEPMRLQHSILVVNSLLNCLEGRIEIHKVAASDEVAVVQMITPYAANLGRSMITDAGYGEWVKAGPADRLLEGKGVAFIKIDVEGHELRTLVGLQQTIRRCRPKMLIEVAECNNVDFRVWVDANGYRIAAAFKHHGENSELMLVPA